MERQDRNLENKNFPDGDLNLLSGEGSGDSQERREARKKRRQRSQLIVFGGTGLAMVLLAVVLVVVVIAFTGHAREEQVQQEQEESQQSVIEQLAATEEDLEPPPVEESTPEPTPEPDPEPTYEQKLDELVNAAIAEMPIEDKVAGLFIVTPEAITGVSRAIRAGDSTREALEQYAVGGIIYSSQNIRSEDQLREMIDNTRQYSRYPLFIGVEEEGGSASSIAGAGLAELVSSAGEIGGSGDTNNAYQAGLTIGSYLSDFGFNLDFAPVADLANVEGSVMRGRAYGQYAAVASPYVSAMVRGLQEQGITACLGHFPGIGSTSDDTHDGLVSTDRSAEEFRSEEFTVFQAGITAGARMIMVGHVGVPALSGDNTSASMSRAIVTDILRNELGYDGVVITDAMNMSAISEYYRSDQAAVLALRAGCDMVLMPEDFMMAYEGVLAAVADGTISEERINDSLRRIYRIKYADMVE